MSGGGLALSLLPGACAAVANEGGAAVDDLKCRVGLAKLLDGGFGDLGSTEIDFLQGGQCAEGGDCLIGDGGIVQVEVLEFFEFGDLLELGVGNIGAVEVEALELFESVKGVEKLVGQVEVGAVDPTSSGPN